MQDLTETLVDIILNDYNLSMHKVYSNQTLKYSVFIGREIIIKCVVRACQYSCLFPLSYHLFTNLLLSLLLSLEKNNLVQTFRQWNFTVNLIMGLSHYVILPSNSVGILK